MNALQAIHSQSISPAGETAATGAAAQSAALVQARFVMALQRPRDWDSVRDRLLRECRRSGFARAAEYTKPIGKGVSGPSIRFVESALRAMGNVDTDVVTVFDDDDKRIVSIYVTDLESNTTFKKSVTIRKTVERHSPAGYEVVGERINKYGKTVYIVRATDDDLLNKENALVSKALRTQGLRLVPGDLVDEAIEICRDTVLQGDAADPDAARKRLADAFSALGVTPADLAEYLGHSLAKTTPAELAGLRAMYAAIRDGEASFQDFKNPVVGDEKQGDEASAKPKETKSSRTKEALKNRRSKGEAPAKKPPQPAPAVDEFAGVGPDAMTDEELAQWEDDARAGS